MVPRLNFGEALAALKSGGKVARIGWDGRGMWLAIHAAEAGEAMTHPYIYMKTVGDERFPWTASQTDLLAEDWTLVDG